VNRKKTAALIIIAIAGALYSLNIREGQIGHVNDDAYYINAARWFAGVQSEQKQLSSRSLGFSLLLAPVARASGEYLLPFRLVPLLFALASLWMVWLIFRKMASPAVCFSVLLLVAFNHLNLIFSTMVMSEEAYLFFSLLALWVFIRRENKRFSYVWSLLQALTLAALSYIRPEGFLLAFSVFAVLLIWRRYRDALYSVFFFILLILPLVTNSFGIGSSLNKYVNELLFPVFYAGLWTVIKTGFIYFLTEISAVAFFTDVISSRMGFFELPAALIVAVVIVSGILSRLTKKGSKMSFRPVAALFALYLVLYTAFHMIWPAKGARFVIPILSFIYYFFFSAIERWYAVGIFGRFRKKAFGVASSSAAGATVTALILMMFAYQNYLILITPVPPLFPETFAYVKDSSKQGDVFVSESAERFFLKTGIKTASPPAYLTADDFYHFILSAGVTRAAFCGLPRLSTKYREFPTMSSAGIKRYAVYLQNAQRFEKEYENKDEGTVIYRLNQTYAANFQKAYEMMIGALNDIKEGKKVEVEKKLIKALDLCPSLTKASDNLLRIYIDLGRGDEAAALINKIEQARRASHITLFLAGELCEKAGKKDRAAGYYRRCANEALKIGDHSILKAAQERLTMCLSGQASVIDN